jgi:hypothetical protein
VSKPVGTARQKMPSSTVRSSSRQITHLAARAIFFTSSSRISTVSGAGRTLAASRTAASSDAKETTSASWSCCVTQGESVPSSHRAESIAMRHSDADAHLFELVVLLLFVRLRLTLSLRALRCQLCGHTLQVRLRVRMPCLSTRYTREPSVGDALRASTLAAGLLRWLVDARSYLLAACSHQVGQRRHLPACEPGSAHG